MEKGDAFIIFAMVGELESVSGAARALGMPKATVSRAVSRLEELYHVKLIERSTRRSVLTEVGKILHLRCVRMREEMEDVDAEIAAHRGDPAGTLRIGCSSDIARSLLTPYLYEFLDMYPSIDVRIRVGERLLPEPNSLDVVIHSGWLSDSRLIARKIVEVRTILVASRAYVQIKGMPASPDDLSGHPIIGNFYLDSNVAEPGRLPAYVPKLELVRGEERYLLPTWRRFASTDHSQILELVRHGNVIAPIAAASAIHDLRSGELVHIFPEFEIYDPPTLYALYTDRVAMVPKLSAFLDFVDSIIQRQRLELQPLADECFPHLKI
ncbi:LysR substrate-binding domain-containing protein [Pseudomonas sp. Z18(2022)]|uniref:LysR substrate-binding domain-containing protein n=1 Tax=Pseudomonas sp. Z18(2022) TaxID=2983410 RepID=UPI002E814F63|nr:LysR substrate-binding domain-containing protein [Pseudomonas sp. Z18(2022)]